MRTLLAIVVGGLLAGALDIVSAFTDLVRPGEATEQGILQYIASGLIGPAAAFAGGWGTAALGLGVHFALTIAMAAVYVIAARWIPWLVRAPWIAGPHYGAALYFLMTYAIVPLSRVDGWNPGTGWDLVGGLMAHCLYVGLPIALIARQFAKPA